MEIESRFYYDLSDYEILNEKLKNIGLLKYKGCFFEKTIQYDNPNPEFSFYSKEVDGRFRYRTSTNIINNEVSTKLSWKRRINNTYNNGIHKEEEVEIKFKSSEEAENILFLIENVLKMPKIESYERYRNIYENDEVEIVVDKFPFIVALEIESKIEDEKAIMKWISKLNLDINKAYGLSWDDKYKEICNEKGIEPSKFVEF